MKGQETLQLQWQSLKIILFEIALTFFGRWKVRTKQPLRRQSGLLLSPAVASRFRFYDFLTDCHERNYPYAPQVAIPAGQGVTAILDGQQCLTALNNGLYGSHAERQARKWASNPEAYPTKHRYLHITG